jgi:iron(III) transport system permease protein
MASIGLARRPAALRRLALRVTPEGVLLAVVAAVIAYLVLSPIAFLFISSFRRYELAGSIKFVFTLANYADAYLTDEFLGALWNSVVYAVGGTAVALAIGSVLAWVVERTNTPLRHLFVFGAAATYLLPGVLVTLAWVLLANARIGSLNHLIRAVLPTLDPTGPLDIGSMAGMVWVFGAHTYPVAFLIMSAAFRSMDPSLEEASALSGAGIVRTLRRVTLGVSRPALLSALLLLIVRGLESFEVPLIIGIPAKIRVLTTEIYSNAALVQPPEPGMSSALGIMLLALSAVGVYFYQRATGRARAFATITGKAYRPRRLDLGRWRYAVLALGLAFFVVTFLLPIAAIVWVSLFRFVVQPSLEALPRAGFSQYQFVLTYPAIVDAIRNSVLNSSAVATIVVVLASLAAWIVLRTRVPGRGLLDGLAFAPIAIPGTIIGLAVLLTYLTLPIPLYGTVFLVTVAHVTMFLPYGMRLASDALLRVHPELEEAAALSGASWARSYRTVLLPLLLPGLIAAWVAIVAVSFRELSATIFLATPQSRFISVVMYSTWSDGNTTASAAVGIVILAVVLVLALVAFVVGRRFRLAD